MNIGKNIDGLINGGGAFLSPQEIVSKCKNGGGGGDLPTPTVADAGSVVVVDEEGKYALGEAGGGHLFVNVIWSSGYATMDKSYSEIVAAFRSGIVPVFISDYRTNGAIFYSLSKFGVNSESGTPYQIEIVQFGDADNLTDVYLFQNATETGTPTYAGGAT